MHRFYVPELGAPGTAAPLPPEEGQHLRRVLRLDAGAAVRVFDGRGREHEASVETLTRDGAILRIGPPADAAPEPGVHVTLAQALLKADKFDAVVRDATMLGAARVQPLVTAHVEAPRGARGGRVERWRRVAISSAKQCGRAVVPEIADPLRLDECLRIADRPLVLLAEPAAGAGAGAIPSRPAAATIVCGPEGGWAPGEIAAAIDAGASPITLGGRTLRADAAPLVALAILLHHWDAF